MHAAWNQLWLLRNAESLSQMCHRPGLDAAMRALTKLAMLVLLSCGSLPQPLAAAVGRCLIFSGTADAIQRQKAVEDSQASLDEAIAKWKVDNKISDPVSVQADKPAPHPYWRSAVSSELFYTPDVVTETSYTLCWRGVVSPVVCTSGAKVCW
jgi:hypothetical protein